MLSAFQKLKNLINGKLENYFIKVNDSKFDNLTDIIGSDRSKTYLITNQPTSSSTSIQGGANHTVLGEEYGNNNAYGYQVSFGPNYIKYRRKMGGTWKEWQQINTANITTGTEFETGRIIDNKKEYGKRIDLGNLPNASTKNVAHGLTNITFTGIDGMAGGYPLPFVNPSDSNSSIALYISGSNIVIITKYDRSSMTGYATVYYTKN